MQVGVVAGGGHQDRLAAERRERITQLVSANRAGNHRARSRCACARSLPASGLRVGPGRQLPRHGGVTACDRNLRLRAAAAERRATAAAMPRPAETSPGDTVRRSESHRRRGRSRNSRTGSCRGPPESWACDRRAADTAPSSGRRESPGRLPIVGVQIVQQRNLLFQLIERLSIHGLSCLHGQNTADRGPIPGKDGGWRAECSSPHPATACLTAESPRETSRRHQRRTVDGSGNRSGSSDSREPIVPNSPDWRTDSHACCRQRKL